MKGPWEEKMGRNQRSAVREKGQNETSRVRDKWQKNQRSAVEEKWQEIKDMRSKKNSKISKFTVKNNGKKLMVCI